MRKRQEKTNRSILDRTKSSLTARSFIQQIPSIPTDIRLELSMNKRQGSSLSMDREKLDKKEQDSVKACLEGTSFLRKAEPPFYKSQLKGNYSLWNSNIRQWFFSSIYTPQRPFPSNGNQLPKTRRVYLKLQFKFITNNILAWPLKNRQLHLSSASVQTKQCLFWSYPDEKD